MTSPYTPKMLALMLSAHIAWEGMQAADEPLMPIPDDAGRARGEAAGRLWLIEASGLSLADLEAAIAGRFLPPAKVKRLWEALGVDLAIGGARVVEEAEPDNAPEPDETDDAVRAETAARELAQALERAIRARFKPRVRLRAMTKIEDIGHLRAAAPGAPKEVLCWA